MSQALYPKQMHCPICNNKFDTMKVKSSACIVTKKDEDFCTYYKDVNPMFYEILVCPYCGYAASEKSFNELTAKETQILKDAFSGRQVERSFCGERNINDALDSFKLALYTANLKSAKSSIIAGLCLKIAWMYRLMDDDKEQQFLNFALENYRAAFDKESLPIGTFNEISMYYLLGELSRRVDKLDDSVFWFGKAIASPEKRANPRIEKMARDQWAIVKEQYKSLKTAENK